MKAVKSVQASFWYEASDSTPKNLGFFHRNNCIVNNLKCFHDISIKILQGNTFSTAWHTTATVTKKSMEWEIEKHFMNSSRERLNWILIQILFPKTIFFLATEHLTFIKVFPEIAFVYFAILRLKWDSLFSKSAQIRAIFLIFSI